MVGVSWSTIERQSAELAHAINWAINGIATHPLPLTSTTRVLKGSALPNWPSSSTKLSLYWLP